MQRHSGHFNIENLVSELEGKAFRTSFSHIMKGIHSATITVMPNAFGEPVTGNVYRKFVYNKYGKVVHKYYYDSTGGIEMKENYIFDSKGNILHSDFITAGSILTEDFDYDKNGNLQTYHLSNPNWALYGKKNKREEYTFENFGENCEKYRKVKKISFGHLGTPELITHYLYEGDAEKYKFRHVTNPDGSLIMTLLYMYNKDRNLKGIHSYFLSPESVNALMKKKGAMESESLTSSHWSFDSNGLNVSFQRDEQEQKYHLEFQSSEIGIPKNGRVITQNSTSEFTKIGRKDYLVKTTRLWPKFDEPKEAEEYTYFDESGKQIYPSIPK